jgi:hypothetical protein
MENLCKQCVFGISFQHGKEEIVLCTNSPEKPGELVEIRPMLTCKNHKAGPLRLDPPQSPNDEIRYIALTRGKFAIVDADDYERLSQYRWFALYTKWGFYAARNSRKDESGKRHTILMHREILGVPHGFLVDHVNNNSLDDRKSNLRPATPSQNICNRRLSKAGCSSKYRGVFWYKRAKKWCAAINHERKYIRLGLFSSEIEAAKAYDAAARKYHGEFARLNFPEGN